MKEGNAASTYTVSYSYSISFDMYMYIDCSISTDQNKLAEPLIYRKILIEISVKNFVIQ